MTHKTGSVGALWSGGRDDSHGLKQATLVALSLLGVALAVVAVYLLVSGPGTAAQPGITAGVEAGSARWAALGAAFAPDYEAIAAVSSARYQALGAHYGPSRARSVDAARWAALGAAFAPDYEAIAAVSSARYQALGEWYAERAGDGR
jgi:hypothetical protein